MKGRWWPWLLLVLALVPALLITTPKHTIPATPSHTVSEAIFQNPNTLDPALAATTSDWAVDTNIFSPLFVVTANGTVQPNLVTRYTISGTTITLVLGKEKVASGATVTAAMVAGALSRPLWPSVHSATAATLLHEVKGSSAVMAGKSTYLRGVTVIDESTLAIQLKRPVTTAFLRNLANPALSIVPTTDMTQGGSNWQLTNLFGTGGYQLSNWMPNGFLTFSKVSGRGPKDITLTVYQSFTEALQSFRNQGVNVVPVQAAQLNAVPKSARGNLRALGSGGTLSLYYRSGAHGISAYPAVKISHWVARSLGGLRAESTVWPSHVPEGRPMTVYVNANQPDAIQLAKTLKSLEPTKVSYVMVSATTLKHLAQSGRIGAYIGEVNWFHSSVEVPLVPARSYWLVSSNIGGLSLSSNGSLRWHSIRLK